MMQANEGGHWKSSVTFSQNPTVSAVSFDATHADHHQCSSLQNVTEDGIIILVMYCTCLYICIHLVAICVYCRSKNDDTLVSQLENDTVQIKDVTKRSTVTEKEINKDLDEWRKELEMEAILPQCWKDKLMKQELEEQHGSFLAKDLDLKEKEDYRPQQEHQTVGKGG
jgi:hypothetical protein